jgi:hypothetical protein
MSDESVIKIVNFKKFFFEYSFTMSSNNVVFACTLCSTNHTVDTAWGIVPASCSSLRYFFFMIACISR